MTLPSSLPGSTRQSRRTGSGSAALDARLKAGHDAHSELEQKTLAVLRDVMDPEIPVISVVDLGIVREVREDEVVITPTYTGCPATQQIERDIRAALDEAGLGHVKLSTVLSPAWTTDWISAEGREKLRDFGIAPPEGRAGKRALFGPEPAVPCPRCGSSTTEMLSEFGSTPCKAQWRCRSCAEPFDYFKCL